MCFISIKVHIVLKDLYTFRLKAQDAFKSEEKNVQTFASGEMLTFFLY